MKSEGQKRFEAALADPSHVVLALENRSYHGASYTLAFGPGQVRYMDACAFFGSSIESLIQAICAVTKSVEILSVPSNMHHPALPYGHDVLFDTRNLDLLLKEANWEGRLRVHHALGRLWMQEGMPTGTYILFHNRLELGSHFAIAECLEAWVRDSSTNGALANSYRSSPEHLFTITHSRDFAVFSRTAFVRERLDVVAREERRRAEAEAAEAERLRTDEDARCAFAEAERLRRSQFTTFVYIMEDTRKGVFKIGRSRTPANGSGRFKAKCQRPICVSASQPRRATKRNYMRAFSGGAFGASGSS